MRARTEGQVPQIDQQLVEQLRPLARLLILIARRKLARQAREKELKRLAA